MAPLLKGRGGKFLRSVQFLWLGHWNRLIKGRKRTIRFWGSQTGEEGKRPAGETVSVQELLARKEEKRPKKGLEEK